MLTSLVPENRTLIHANARRFCFTINNYTAKDEEDIQLLYAGGLVKGLLYKPEIGANGTPHLQGYLELTSPRRVRFLSARLPRGHIEVARGNRRQNIEYVRKKDTAVGDVVMLGELPDDEEKGKRNDLRAACEKIKETGSIAALVEEHPNLYIRYHGGFEKYAFKCMQERAGGWRNVSVICFIGATGTGKTRKAYEIYPSCFKIEFAANTPEWWDGYSGQDALLIDDYDGGLPISRIKVILDGHPLRLPVKGGHTWAAWTRVVITANEGVDEWYPFLSEPHKAAIKRRINDIFYFPLNILCKKALRAKIQNKNS